MFRQYGGLRAAIGAYWEDYGGWKDIIQSPLVHFSIFASILSFAGLIRVDWRTLTVGMMPTLLGFSLAAYAITFSLMGSKLHAALATATDSSGRPLSISVNATFFHSVFIQVICLLFAVVSKGNFVEQAINWVFDSRLSSWFIYFETAAGTILGCFLLVYAICLLLSAAMAMFRLGRLAPAATKGSSAANDVLRVAPEPSAQELYGFRWTIVRVVAKLLRVKG